MLIGCRVNFRHAPLQRSVCRNHMAIKVKPFSARPRLNGQLGFEPVVGANKHGEEMHISGRKVERG